MDDLLKQVYPEGEERWIKVRYINPEVAMKVLRLTTPNFDSRKFGFETVSLGLREEFMPQVEALIELKAELQTNPMLYTFEGMEHVQNLLDFKIQQVLDKTLLSKM